MRVHKEDNQQATLLTLANNNQPIPILNPPPKHPLTPNKIRPHLMVPIRLQLTTHLSPHHLRLQLTVIITIN